MSKSYAQILKTSTITGGSAAAGLVISMISVKTSAVFLGPSGVGVLRLFLSLIATMTTLAGLGIGSSGVKEIAEADASGDEARLGRTTQVVRRMSLLTGLAGSAITAILCLPLAWLVFDATDRATSVAIVGIAVALAIVAAGQVAIVRGRRRIGDLARINVQSALAGLLVSAPLYWFFRDAAIVPAILASSALSLAISWLHARRVATPPCPRLAWGEVLSESRRLIGLGVAMMWAGLLSTIVMTAAGAMILRELGSESNGYYAAAWALSGLFANFILSAMEADYFPRLATVQQDHEACSRLVNEQAEIGVLLALPGIVATLFFAPLAIHAFYSADFAPAADLLPWFVLGVFGRITSWPLGFVLLAKGSARLFVTMETAFSVLHLGLIAVGLQRFGLVGVGMAFFALYLLYNIAIFIVVRRLIGFQWTRHALELVAIATALIATTFLLRDALEGWQAIAVGACITLVSLLASCRGIAMRVGHEHRLVRLGKRVPVFRSMLARWLPPVTSDDRSTPV